MRTGHLDVSVDVAAPAQAVWDYVTDWERQGEWIPFTRVRVEPAPDGDGVGDGQVVVARTAVGPIGFDDVIRVVGTDPPHRCDVEHVGWLVRGPGYFLVEPRGGGCRFTWGERAEVPGGPLAPLLWRLAAPGLQVGFGIALRRLRNRVERGA